MSVSVRDARALPADRRWIEGVYRDYLDDLAPLSTGVFPILGEVGHSEPDQLARWFADSSAHLLLILQSSLPVGFAMVACGGLAFAGRRSITAWPSLRRAADSVGRASAVPAAPLILDRFPGSWYRRRPAQSGCGDLLVARGVAVYPRRFRERVANARSPIPSFPARRGGRAVRRRAERWRSRPAGFDPRTDVAHQPEVFAQARVAAHRRRSSPTSPACRRTWPAGWRAGSRRWLRRSPASPERA